MIKKLIKSTVLYFAVVFLALATVVFALATKSGDFPTSLNTFQDGDLINAGDWNALETTMGITTSSDKTSLNGKWNDLFASTTLPQITTLLNLTSIGIIGSGVWQGTAINQTYLVGQSGINTGDQINITGNAGTATKLQTARTIAGVSFDGTANISLNNNAITNGAGYITSAGSGTVSTSTNETVNSIPFWTTTSATPALLGSNTSFVWDNITNRLGIGTTTPYAPLSVVGEVVSEYFTATSTTATSTFGGGFNIGSGGLVYDFSTSMVGIGTASPTDTLSVTGDVYINGTCRGCSTTARKTVDEIVNNSTTLQADDELLFTVKANEVWSIRAFLVYDTGTTPDIQFGWIYPSGTTAWWGFSDLNGNTTNSITGSPYRIGGGAGFERNASPEGVFFVGGTGGTIKLRWAQNTADVSDTKLLTGSYIIATRLDI